MTNWHYLNDFDFSYDDTSETLDQMLEKLAHEIPTAFIKINYLIGSGGGWPQGEAVIHSRDLRKFFEFFGYDDDVIDDCINDLQPLERL